MLDILSACSRCSSSSTCRACRCKTLQGLYQLMWFLLHVRLVRFNEGVCPEHIVLYIVHLAGLLFWHRVQWGWLWKMRFEELGQWFIRLHMCLSHFAVWRNPYNYYSLTNYQLFRAYSLVRKYNVARQIGILAGKVACRLLYYLPTINSHYASIIIDRLTYYQYFFVGAVPFGADCVVELRGITVGYNI